MLSAIYRSTGSLASRSVLVPALRLMSLATREWPKEGITVPQVNFRVREDYRLKKVTTNDLFANKRVIVFSLPGAYTPTCSSAHVPGFDWLAPHFRKLGIDDVICMSVNDPFVMEKWAKDMHVKNVRMIGDGNGEFTKQIGLLVDKSESGLGERSWRYSMVVKDKVVEKFFIEPRKPGDPFEVSDALTMMKYIAPEYKIPEFFTVFTRNGCPHCAKAKALLDSKNLSYEEIPIEDRVTTQTLKAVSGSNTTPQCFSRGKLIGDSEALEQYVKNIA